MKINSLWGDIFQESSLGSLHIFNHIDSFCMCAWCMCLWRSRDSLQESISSLQLLQGSHPGGQAWQQAPSPTQLSPALFGVFRPLTQTSWVKQAYEGKSLEGLVYLCQWTKASSVMFQTVKCTGSLLAYWVSLSLWWLKRSFKKGSLGCHRDTAFLNMVSLLHVGWDPDTSFLIMVHVGGRWWSTWGKFRLASYLDPDVMISFAFFFFNGKKPPELGAVSLVTWR